MVRVIFSLKLTISENNLTFIIKKLLTKIKSYCSIRPSGTRDPNMHLPEDKEINYMEESIKIAKIKKSCHAGKIAANIFLALAIFMLAVGICGGIKVLVMGKEFDDMVTSGRFAGVVSTDDEIGSASAININLGSVPLDIHSDIPAVQAAIDDHPMSVVYGTYILSMSIIMLAVIALIFLVRSVFAIIEKEGNPFTVTVRKRIKTVLIATSIVLFLTSGTGPAILGILVTVAINAILDYGITLQTQADETL